MLIEGLKLMMMGMTTVFLFLSVMIVVTLLVSHLTRNIAAKELAGIEAAKKQRASKQKQKQKQKKTGPSPIGEEVPLAVFAAAIAAYEEERNR